MTIPTRTCPLCKRSFPARGRQRYCSHACRQRAYRRRQPQPQTPSAATTIARPLTVYECPACETRYLGQQRCPDCNSFCHRLGPGGPCPHCDEPTTTNELLHPI